jgi:hypothetical protein
MKRSKADFDLGIFSGFQGLITRFCLLVARVRIATRVRIANCFPRATSVLSATTILLATTALLTSGTAQAHTTLISSKPPEQEVVSKLPQSVELTFGEPLETLVSGKVNQISVVDSSGSLLNSGPAKVSLNGLIQPIKSNSAPGAVTVNYRVAAADGHVLESSFIFYYKSKPDQAEVNKSRSPLESNLPHSHGNSSSTQRTIYSASTILILFSGVWGIWYYRRKTKKL